MYRFVSKVFEMAQGNGPLTPPKPTHVSSFWHEPQFAKVYDAQNDRHCIAMLIAVPEALFDGDHPDGPDPMAMARVAREIDRYARSGWASAEAAKTAGWFNDHLSKGFVVILEHAATGAYATRTQQIKAFYAFDGTTVGAAERKGLTYDNETVYQCVTL